MKSVLGRQQALLQRKQSATDCGRKSPNGSNNFYLVHGQAHFIFLIITPLGVHCNYRSYLMVEETDAHTDCPRPHGMLGVNLASPSGQFMVSTNMLHQLLYGHSHWPGLTI